MSETVIVQSESNAEVEGEVSTDLGNSATWDDLDTLTSTESSEQELMADAREFLEKGSEETTEAEEDKSKVPSKSERKKEEITNEAEEKGTQKETDPTEKINYTQGSFKDITQEIAEDTSFKKMVDGEEVDVTLKDLLDNYAGKIPFNKKYQEFSEERKQHQKEVNNYKAELDNINKYIDAFAEKVKNKDGLGALSALAEFAGMKPYEFKRELLQQIAPEIDRLRELSSDQQSNEQLKEEKQFLEEQSKLNEIKREEEQAILALQQEISQLQKDYGIPDEDFNSAYFELKEANIDNISPSKVAEYCIQKTSLEKASNLINDSLPDLSSDEYIRENVAKMVMEYPDLSDSDFIDVIKEAYGNAKQKKKSSKAVSKKLDANNNNNQKSKVRQVENYIDFDDI